MGSLISLIIIFILSILITKIATEMLIHTGLSKPVAKFQARSAFTGVGYTTNETESIVRHPVRRRIVLSLMLIGNVGIISAVASLMLTFISQQEGGLPNYIRIIVIVGSLGLLWIVSKSRWADRILAHWIKRALEKFTSITVRDYVELLHLSKEYEITVITVSAGDWIENKKLKDIHLRKEGLNLISIKRSNGEYVGTPHGDTQIYTGDGLIIYGRKKAIRNLERRRSDYRAKLEHEKAMKEQEKELEKQEKVDS